jgi:hypothetical protein
MTPVKSDRVLHVKQAARAFKAIYTLKKGRAASARLSADQPVRNAACDLCSIARDGTAPR